MRPEFQPTPAGDMESQIFAGVNAINAWVAARNQRSSHADTTRRKLATRLAAMTAQFRNRAAYIQTPLVLLPHEDGAEEVGIGETTGEIVGFAYRSYPTLTGDMELGPIKEGVVTIVATEGTDSPKVTPASWNQVIPPEARAVMRDCDDYTKKGVVPVIIPIVEGTHFTEITNNTPLHFDPAQLLAAESKPQATDYREYVAKIEGMMKGRLALSTERDKPLMSALHREFQALHNNCPLMGQRVTVTASYMRTPSMRTPGSHTVLSGTITGVLRKFVYAPYFPGDSHPHLKASGAVQAVIYQPEVAAAVYSGRLSPEVADSLPGTILVPLDQKHTLEATTD